MSESSGRVFLTRMGLRNIKTNSTLSAASVLVLVSCLMLIGLVFLGAVNFRAMFTQFSMRNVVMVYLRPGLEPQQIAAIEERIRRLPGVEGCDYVSSQTAFERMQKQNQQDYALLEGVDPGFLPDGFEVSPKNLNGFDDLVYQLNHLDEGVTSVRHFQGVANQLSAIQKALGFLGAAVIGVLLLVSLFIISSTVQATMHSRQQEIRVMKSVGAASAFIRWPFLVEGVMLGLLGSAAALLVVFLVYLGAGRMLDPFLSRLLSGFHAVSFYSQLKILLPGFLCLGVVTGGGGSMLSITRYLKEKVYEKSELEEEA